VAKLFGKIFDMSPVMIENVLKGYLSGVLLPVWMATDYALRGAEGAPKAPSREIFEWPPLQRFIQRETPTGTLDDLYDLRDRAREVARTVTLMSKTGRPDEAVALAEKEAKLHSTSKSVEKLARDLAGLRQYRKLIENDRDLSRAEKRQQIEEIRKIEQQIGQLGRDLRREAYR